MQRRDAQKRREQRDEGSEENRVRMKGAKRIECGGRDDAEERMKQSGGILRVR